MTLTLFILKLVAGLATGLLAAEIWKRRQNK